MLGRIRCLQTFISFKFLRFKYVNIEQPRCVINQSMYAKVQVYEPWLKVILVQFSTSVWALIEDHFGTV